MKKIILKTHLAPGDMVTLTAAVRDLHLSYPYQYHVDVDTVCPALWENNPYLIKLDPNDPDVETIECHYPLVDTSNSKPYHFIHGYLMLWKVQPLSAHSYMLRQW